jgi:hypothetical protein
VAISKALPIAVLVVAALAVFSLNTFPVLTNDSLLYLDYSRSLDTFGWVTGGYRQFGYPLYLALVRGAADLFGVEPLFATAIIQRGLLLVAVVLAWIHWRWWSLPFVFLLLTAETLVYSNLLLIEGLALPLAALIVFPTIYCLRTSRDGSYVEKRRTVLMLTTLVALIALTLFCLRFTLLVFGAVPLALTIAYWRTELRRSVTAIFAIFILAGALITLVMSVENHEEWGVFSPSAYSAPVRYYYAWMLVFRVNPENQTDPDLAEFYDDGRLREFITSVWLDDTTHEEKWALYDQRTEAMLDAAGISIMGSRLSSMAWSLAGGRVNDVGSALALIIPATRDGIEEAMYLNSYYEENGAAAFGTGTTRAGWGRRSSPTRSAGRCLRPGPGG